LARRANIFAHGETPVGVRRGECGLAPSHSKTAWRHRFLGSGTHTCRDHLCGNLIGVARRDVELVGNQRRFDDVKTIFSISPATRTIILAMLLGSSIMPIRPANAADDIAAGRDEFAARCAACHALHPTRKPGPVLLGIYGRRAGSVPGYRYSAALKSASITWNAANLDRWLQGPPAFIPGVNMQAQVDSPQDRQDIIAFLRSLGPATPTREAGVTGQ
jgi:cytochrome c